MSSHSGSRKVPPGTNSLHILRNMFQKGEYGLLSFTVDRAKARKAKALKLQQSRGFADDVDYSEALLGAQVFDSDIASKYGEQAGKEIRKIINGISSSFNEDQLTFFHDETADQPTLHTCIERTNDPSVYTRCFYVTVDKDMMTVGSFADILETFSKKRDDFANMQSVRDLPYAIRWSLSAKDAQDVWSCSSKCEAHSDPVNGRTSIGSAMGITSVIQNMISSLEYARGDPSAGRLVEAIKDVTLGEVPINLLYDIAGVQPEETDDKAEGADSSEVESAMLGLRI